MAGRVHAAQPRRWGAGNLREIVMGAQDNLTTVLAVVLGVAIGSGDLRTVALAGLAAGVAEAVSMAGVLYTATRAEAALIANGRPRPEGSPALNDPLVAAAVTFAAAIVAAMIPLAPFVVLPLRWAAVVSFVLSLGALFALGSWTGTVTKRSRLRAGLRFVSIGGMAALAAALVGAALRTGPV